MDEDSVHSLLVSHSQQGVKAASCPCGEMKAQVWKKGNPAVTEEGSSEQLRV